MASSVEEEGVRGVGFGVDRDSRSRHVRLVKLTRPTKSSVGHELRSGLGSARDGVGPRTPRTVYQGRGEFQFARCSRYPNVWHWPRRLSEREWQC